jgi:Fusaric acid resistance protein-like
MFENIDFRTMRALQISLLFLASIAMQRLLHFAHAGWIGFTVMVFYSGIDSGTSIFRTVHRFWGTMLAILLSCILWWIMRKHSELIFLVTLAVVFMAFFTAGKYYFLPTVFTVTLTFLGIDYYVLDHYNFGEFFFDYARCTMIGAAICIFFEFFIFKNSSVSYKYYFELRQTFTRQLEQLFTVVITKPLRQSQYLKLSAQCNSRVIELNTFLNNTKHDFHINPAFFAELEQYDALLETTYSNIRQLFVENANPILILETQKLLAELSQMSIASQPEEMLCLK